MGAEGKLPPKQRTRKRSPAEPEAPARTHGRRGGRGGPPPLGQATPVDGDLAGRSPSRSRSSWTKGRPTPPPQAVHRMCSSAGWARPRHPGRQCTSAGTARSGSGAPASWQHERVHARDAARDAPSFYCSFCPSQFSCQREATVHERGHTGEKLHACFMCRHGSATRATLRGTCGPNTVD